MSSSRVNLPPIIDRIVRTWALIKMIPVHDLSEARSETIGSDIRRPKSTPIRELERYGAGVFASSAPPVQAFPFGGAAAEDFSE
jgi:hypothetical protein